MAVVAGALPDGASPQVIDAAVAHMGKEGGVILNQAQGAGGPGPGFEGQARPQGDEIQVGPPDCQVEKADGVEHRVGDALERIPHRFDRQLGGLGAVRMTTHAVHGDQEHRTLTREDLDPILVFLAIANQAQICKLDAQGNSGGNS